ncbi:hypothetical protein J6590_038993, partial [Homalodisca vitripennis]
IDGILGEGSFVGVRHARGSEGFYRGGKLGRSSERGVNLACAVHFWAPHGLDKSWCRWKGPPAARTASRVVAAGWFLFLGSRGGDLQKSMPFRCHVQVSGPVRWWVCCAGVGSSSSAATTLLERGRFRERIRRHGPRCSSALVRVCLPQVPVPPKGEFASLFKSKLVSLTSKFVWLFPSLSLLSVLSCCLVVEDSSAEVSRQGCSFWCCQKSPESASPLLVHGSLHEGPKILPKLVVGVTVEDAVVRGVSFSAVTEVVSRVPEAVMVLPELAMPRQKLSEYMNLSDIQKDGVGKTSSVRLIPLSLPLVKDLFPKLVSCAISKSLLPFTQHLIQFNLQINREFSSDDRHCLEGDGAVCSRYTSECVPLHPELSSYMDVLDSVGSNTQSIVHHRGVDCSIYSLQCGWSYASSYLPHECLGSFAAGFHMGEERHFLIEQNPEVLLLLHVSNPSVIWGGRPLCRLPAKIMAFVLVDENCSFTLLDQASRLVQISSNFSSRSGLEFPRTRKTASSAKAMTDEPCGRGIHRRSSNTQFYRMGPRTYPCGQPLSTDICARQPPCSINAFMENGWPPHPVESSLDVQEESYCVLGVHCCRPVEEPLYCVHCAPPSPETESHRCPCPSMWFVSLSQISFSKVFPRTDNRLMGRKDVGSDQSLSPDLRIIQCSTSADFQTDG